LSQDKETLNKTQYRGSKKLFLLICAEGHYSSITQTSTEKNFMKGEKPTELQSLNWAHNILRRTLLVRGHSEA
jgi:hypothetical protein